MLIQTISNEKGIKASMARPSTAEDMKTFLSALPRNQSIGNISLRSALGWSDTRYWRIHGNLVDTGRIVRGRGRGGTVARLTRAARALREA